MTPDEAVRSFTTLLDPTIKPYGFRRRGDTYRLIRDNNAGIIDIQRSQMSRSDRVILTINIGVFSHRIHEFYWGRKSPNRALITDCHMRLRIGKFLSEHNDKWWIISHESIIVEIANEVKNILNQSAIPMIVSSISDESIRDMALSGSLPGATERMRLEYLSILLRDHGPEDQLPEVLRMLRATASDARQLATIETHIEKLLLHT